MFRQEETSNAAEINAYAETLHCVSVPIKVIFPGAGTPPQQPPGQQPGPQLPPAPR